MNERYDTRKMDVKMTFLAKLQTKAQMSKTTCLGNLPLTNIVACQAHPGLVIFAYVVCQSMGCTCVNCLA